MKCDLEEYSASVRPCHRSRGHSPPSPGFVPRSVYKHTCGGPSSIGPRFPLSLTFDQFPMIIMI